ncbi:MAG: radical SAM protein [bacterium]
MSHWIAPVFLPHAGCPHRCVFCDQAAIAGSPSAPTPAEVGRRLELLFAPDRGRRPGRVRQIAFFGGSFTGLDGSLQEAYLRVAGEHRKRGRIDSVRISTRPDALPEARIRFLAERGVHTIELGVQSLSDTVLEASRRGHRSVDSVEAIERVRRAGLEVGAQIMLGLPGDTGRQSLETADALCALKPDFVRIYPTLVLRGTELAERTRAGRYVPLGLEAAVSLAAEVLGRFAAASIPVIRIGLHQTEDLRGTAVAAGPCHPAFGYLVRARLYYKTMCSVLGKTQSRGGGALLFRIHPRDRSLFSGHRRSHHLRLEREFGVREIRVEEDCTLARGAVEVAPADN